MKDRILEINERSTTNHRRDFDHTSSKLTDLGHDVPYILEKLQKFQVAIPSWALGAGGTRFGRFGFGGEPSTLEEKIKDVSTIHKLTHTAGSISLHIPWDIPSDPSAIRQLADQEGIEFDAVNSNTFQDQSDQPHSYKYGSLCNESKAVRDQAIQHNLEVIRTGKQLGSKSITVWLADGSSYPGQASFRRTLQHTADSLGQIYHAMPNNWSMYIEYKPYEPNFYHTVIQDWGTSYMLASETGERAYTLVDLGHHLPNTNIENIVSTLIYKGKLGGFHFNDSKYGDDDLTVGSIKPYQLFLIFNELIGGMNDNINDNPDLAWMIDASHNVKDPLEDLIQSLEAIQIAYAQALLINQQELKSAQMSHDVVRCQEILQNAYRTDVRPLVANSRLLAGAAIDPIGAYRSLKIRETLIQTRGRNSQATGL